MTAVIDPTKNKNTTAAAAVQEQKENTFSGHSLYTSGEHHRTGTTNKGGLDGDGD